VPDDASRPRLPRLLRNMVTLAVALSAAVALGAPGASATAAVAFATAAAADTAADGDIRNYVVIGAEDEGVAALAAAVDSAGGLVLSSYPEIGVVTAQARDAGFLDAVRAAPAVTSAAPTRTAPIGGGSPEDTTGGTLRSHAATRTLAPPLEPLEADQWNMEAIGAPHARALSTGAPEVVVGVLDRGIDATHPDLADRVDPDRSVGCAVNGVPDTASAAWSPVDGIESHGSQVAGIVAASDDGAGMVGVAPGATLASVKVVDHAGFIYPEYALCGYMWAAQQGFDVTNASFFVDPYMFWCESDADQAPVLEALRRAIRHSTDAGVLNVAAAGNAGYDLSAKTTDDTSPNDSEPIAGRDVSGGCSQLPAEVDGVVTVAALEETDDGVAVSGYSNFGEGVIDLAAPGTDVLSTLPGGDHAPDSGTSMAAPHVAGVAALLATAHPDASPARLAELLAAQATPVGEAAFSGAGMVDAFTAVSADIDPSPGPVIGVPETVRSGRPFEVRASNWEPGEEFEVSGLDIDIAGGGTVDERGRARFDATVAAGTAAGPGLFFVEGSVNGAFVAQVEVREGIAPPVITSPTTEGESPADAVTVTGSGLPGAEVTVSAAPTVDEVEPDGVRATAERRQVRSAAAPPPITVTLDRTGTWSVELAPVAEGSWTITAVQELDRTVSPEAAIDLRVVAAPVPPTPTPTTPPGAGTPSAPGTPAATPAGAHDVTAPARDRRGADSRLARTGAEAGTLLLPGALALLLGAALVAAARVRSARTAGPSEPED